jgi:hypothetical protein
MQMTTFFNNNIEYVIPTVFKATMQNWAHDLINNGTIYFSNIMQFINDPHYARGDINEGTHVSVRNGTPCTTHFSSLPVYIWCCTLDSQPCRVLQTWHDKNCVIQILDTVEFAKRLLIAIGQQHPNLWPLQIGPVVYTKTTGGYERTDWVDYIFQKDGRYDGQKEFRFALTGKTGEEAKEHIVLTLGSCSDIVRLALVQNP